MTNLVSTNISYKSLKSYNLLIEDFCCGQILKCLYMAALRCAKLRKKKWKKY